MLRIFRCFPAFAYLDAANLITGFNVALAVAGITLVIAGRPDLCAMAIFSAAICDYLDGHIARSFLAGNTDNREFGKQLDTLADLLNFSVVPAVAMVVSPGAHAAAAATAAILVLSSVLRLAHFTIASPPSGYTGVPTTYTGFVLANVLLLTARNMLPAYWLPGLAAVFAVLQLINIPVRKFRAPVVVTAMSLLFIGTASIAYL